MNIKSPFQNTGSKRPQENVLDLILGMSQKMGQLDDAITSANETRKKLEEDNNRREAEHVSMTQEHNQYIQTLGQAIDVVEHVHTTMMVGKPGKDAAPVDTKAIIEQIKSGIRQPKDGETPIVDEQKIARLASKYIKIPEINIPTPEPIDHQAIVDMVFEELQSGKKKLSTKHIGDFPEGLEQTIAPIRRLAAGFRGGGDVVLAGSNITITTNSDGKKVIASTSGGGTFVYNEVVSGSGTSFTLANTPLAGTVVVHGAGVRLTPGVGNDYTISGAVITFNSPLTYSSGQVLADYQK